MIADWTVDVGSLSPSIDVPWEGWIDLFWGPGDHYWTATPWRPERAAALPEVWAYPELLDCLKLANWLDQRTSKLDVFPVSSDEVDPEIEDGPRTRYGLGSYLDIVSHRIDVFPTFEHHEAFARKVASNLGKMELADCCAEIVIRPAHLFEQPTYGWTIYAMGFGPDAEAARARWAKCLRLVVPVTLLQVAFAVGDFWAEREVRRKARTLGTSAATVGE